MHMYITICNAVYVLIAVSNNIRSFYFMSCNILNNIMSIHNVSISHISYMKKLKHKSMWHLNHLIDFMQLVNDKIGTQLMKSELPKGKILLYIYIYILRKI